MGQCDYFLGWVGFPWHSVGFLKRGAPALPGIPSLWQRDMAERYDERIDEKTTK